MAPLIRAIDDEAPEIHSPGNIWNAGVLLVVTFTRATSGESGPGMQTFCNVQGSPTGCTWLPPCGHLVGRLSHVIGSG